MSVIIGISPSFPLYTLNNTTKLQLPAIDLIPMGSDEGDNILIESVNCTVQGRPQYLAKQIQDAYEESFKKYGIPLTLSYPKRFLPVCQLSEKLPSKAEFELEICINYLENQSQQIETQQCSLNWKDERMNHQGWLAIDFGTSNSTVTFFDLKERPQPNDLSREQKEQLFRLYRNWLNSPPDKVLPDVSESSWHEFLEQVNRNLDSALQDILASDDFFRLLEVIRKIEVYLGGRQDSLGSAVIKKLNHIYHEVFQIPPLQEEQLIPGELDENRPGEKQIISELEIINLGDQLEVKMGSLVPTARLNTFSQGNKNEGKVESKFHHSPKRYLGKEGAIDIQTEGQNYLVEYKQLIKAALQHLIELTQRFKDKEENRSRCSPGNFYRAIVTYPTVALPVVRREIEELVSDLGFTDVNISYDEAIAASIFYLWREFGGNKNIGLEAFKTRCRRSGDVWVQNLLVLDIGGGTTDIALIRLLLEENDPFKPGEDRGAGGRYYRLTPELWGSSGHLQLGGELITLKLFRLIKVAIADCLLTAVTENKLTNPHIETVINRLERQFRPEGKYSSQSLINVFASANAEGDTSYKLTLDYAEDIIHTRWKKDERDHPEYLQAFYTLWDWAEEAKIQLGRGAQEYEIPWDALTELLAQNDIDLDTVELSVKISKQQFETAATSVVDEAVRIAKGLLESRLPKNDISDNQKEHKEPLDWLILSGQTCNLDLVKREIKRVFNLAEFTWNSARITFVPEYAKLATSVGACYAWKLQQYGYNLEDAKSKLRNGDSELSIQVKNLLYTLPCSFERVTQDGKSTEIIFEPRQQLTIMDNTGMAKARSEWLPAQPTISVLRKDFDNAKPIPWADLNFQFLAKQIGVSTQNNDFTADFKVQFEVNQKLEINLLLCRRNPYHVIATDLPSLDVTKKISEEIAKIKEKEPDVPEIISDGVIKWEIAVGVVENSRWSVFEPGAVLDQNFLKDDEDTPDKGLISKKPLPPFPNNRKHTFYAFYPSMAEEKHALPIDVLGPPEGNIKENYSYYVTIDDEGCLRIHEGEVPYWRSSDKEVLKDKTGCVIQVNPNLQSQKDDDERNPFCGLH